MKPGDRYQLLEKIASGSFATVYRAHDAELGREVAVKQIHEQFLSDPKQLDRYWSEAQLLASLQHPNVVTIYDIVREKGWLIMELMQGNLSEKAQGRPMDLVGLRTVLAHSLRALKFLHERGIVHGDVKPSNLLVDRRKRLKLGDFGLARRVSDDEGSLIKGTTKYMAPEVVSDDFGDVGPASDLYSLGFSAYELMCGSKFDSLFPGLNAHGRDKQLAWIMWHAAPDRRLPPISRVLEGVPEDLAKVIQKLSTKDLKQRYRTADEALADLNVDLRVVKSEEVPEKPPEGDPAAKRKRMIVVGGFVASMLVCSLMLLMGDSPPPKPAVQSGLVREVRMKTREMVVVDEATGIPEIIKLGARPSLLLTNTHQKVLLEDVMPGDRIRVTGQPPRLEFVLSRPVNARGKILRIDGVQKLIVVQTNDAAERAEIPVRISASSKVMLNGSDAQFNDLQEDDRVDVQHLEDSRDGNIQKALEVSARRTVRATGFVRTLNWEKKTLTFDVRQGLTSRTMVLPFAENCLITLPNNSQVTRDAIKAEDLQSSDRVAIEYDTQITRVTATRNKSLTGVVMSINPGERNVTIQAKDAQQHTLRVSAETEIDIVSKRVSLEDLRAFDETRVTYLDHDDGAGPEAVTIDATRPVRHDRLAILIGEQNYADRSVSRTDYILDDVQMLADTLRQRYCVAPERLLLYKDADRARIQEEVTQVLQNTLSDTLVIVFFEGQAAEGMDGKFYLAAHDFQHQQVAQTGLPLQWLVDALEKCASKDKLLILDSFQVGDSQKYAPQPSPAKMLKSVSDSMKTTRCLAARSDKEFGQAWLEKSHGWFAWELSQAFQGAADADRDLQIKPEELLNYLQPALASPKFDKGKPQTPALFGGKD